ncbi:hypothetical protein JW960_11370 [candidate division KSB1 bacterium]|nr:hypothetical protein [candidate division KSB1 bacterium]
MHRIHAKRPIMIVAIMLLIISAQALAGGKWYNYYDDGLEQMKQQHWARAIENFREAVKVKPRDMQQIKTYGMHFIEYFPHREIGICLYNLGQMEEAKRQLTLSLRNEYSSRAQEYMDKIGGGVQPPAPEPVKPLERLRDRIQTPTKPEPEVPQPVVPSAPTGQVKLVGERMGLAILPFSSKGLGVEIRDIDVTEQMMTSFYNLNRFKLFERTQLEKVLQEQQLGMTGVIDASTAAEIGKGIGVDAIVLGSLSSTGRNIALDVRLIDTETAQIITAKDEMTDRVSIQDLKDMVQRLVSKIGADIPLVDGYVISVDGDQLTLDLGLNIGIKKGMKCVVYREGQEIIHPITKQVLGKQTEELGQIKLVQVYPQYSIGKVIKSEIGIFEVGNKVVTK